MVGHGRLTTATLRRRFLSFPEPVAQELGENSLMFEVHPTLTVSHMTGMADIVEEVMA